MRKRLRRHLPDHETLRANRWLAVFGDTLLHPRLWHLNRHSAAGAVALGLFCGLIPGPLQMLVAAALCVIFKVNLPLALLTTLYTNPLTIVPLYLVAYQLGKWVIPGAHADFIPPPEWHEQSFVLWAGQVIDWMADLGKPLALGLLLLAVILALVGYFAVRTGWRAYSVHAWRKRSHQRGR